MIFCDGVRHGLDLWMKKLFLIVSQVTIIYKAVYVTPFF